MKYLLDTYIVSSWATREHPASLMRLLQTPPCAPAICSVVKTELLCGLALKPSLIWANVVRKMMGGLTVVPFDEAVAMEAARVPGLIVEDWLS
jgi:predicted nucleic acid-binding protein